MHESPEKEAGLQRAVFLPYTLGHHSDSRNKEAMSLGEILSEGFMADSHKLYFELDMQPQCESKGEVVEIELRRIKFME